MRECRISCSFTHLYHRGNNAVLYSWYLRRFCVTVNYPDCVGNITTNSSFQKTLPSGEILVCNHTYATDMIEWGQAEKHRLLCFPSLTLSLQPLPLFSCRRVSFMWQGSGSPWWVTPSWCIEALRSRATSIAARTKRTAETACSSAASRKVWKTNTPTPLATAEISRGTSGPR